MITRFFVFFQIIAVVVDYRQNKSADTGDFQLIYKDSQKVVPSPPYIGVSLQVRNYY